MPTGVIFVLSAPSGAGKSTLIERIRPLFPDILYSISYTTRAARKGEVDGIHYHFVSEHEFRKMIKADCFLEWKEVHGNLYGITDLGVYLSGKQEPFGLKSRILLVSSSYKINSGFIVPNLLGIRNLSEFELDQTSGAELRNGVTHIYRDKEGRPWYELDLRTLTREKNFLQIAR